MKVVGINPDWSVAAGLLPTDTLRPPRSFPIEWGYLISEAASNAETEFKFVDLNMPQRVSVPVISALRDAEFVVIATAPSYLFWRCPPLWLGAVKEAVTNVRASSHATIVLVGPHGTVLPAPTLRSTGADYVFRGEPDRGLLPELRALHAKQEPKHLGSSRKPDVAICPENLELGAVTYLASEVQAAQPHAWIRSAAVSISGFARASALLETARGCSFNCPFCLRSGFRRTLRLKSLDTLTQELDALVDLGVGYVYLIDENFGLPLSHAESVCDLLCATGIKFGVQTRPDIWSAERIDRLAASGCIYVELGTETVDEETLAGIGKFRHPQLAWKATKVFREKVPFVGINSFDVSNPDLGLHVDAKILKDLYGDPVAPFIPYPTTPWGDHAIAQYAGLPLDWEHVADLHVLYSLISKRGWAALTLRGSRRLRAILLRAIAWARRVQSAASASARSTRHERIGKRRPS